MLSRDMAKLLKVTSNGRSYYVEKLKKGEIVGVAVGGVEEACFDFDYNTEWGSRTGFANVALEAGKEIKLNLTSSIKGQSSSVPLHKSLYEILKIWHQLQHIHVWNFLRGHSISGPLYCNV